MLIIITLILLAVAVNIFGDSSQYGSGNMGDNIQPTPSESRMSRIYTVSYKNGVFSPTNLRIHVGDTVRFRNDGLIAIRVASDPHPLHNGLLGFDSIGDIPAESYFSFTFATKGVFGYHNEKNLNETGAIIVR